MPSWPLRRECEDWEGSSQLKCMFIDQLWLSALLEKGLCWPIDEAIISLLPSTSLWNSVSWASSGLYKDTAFIVGCNVCVRAVNLSLAVLLSALLTACHPQWDSSEQIFTLINTDSSLDVSLQRSAVKINRHCHLWQRYQGVLRVWHKRVCVCACVTCYSRHAAVGGKRWWWERSCAIVHQRGGRGRTRSAACL